MKREIEKYFFPNGEKSPYWISFDIDGVDKREFASTGTPEEQGLSLDFIKKFFEVFLPESVGMDFTEVNFLQSDEEQAEIDMLTVRLLIEKIVQTVHHKDRQRGGDEGTEANKHHRIKYQYNV